MRTVPTGQRTPVSTAAFRTFSVDCLSLECPHRVRRFAFAPEPDSPASPPRPGDDNDFTSDSDSDSTNSSSSGDSGSSDDGKKKAKTSGAAAKPKEPSRKRSLVQEVDDGSPPDKDRKVDS